MSNRTIAPIDQLPADVRQLIDSTLKCMSLYMTGTDQLQMLVGRNVTATIKFSGGPITKEVISDTMAHLAFYKKYFPKEGDTDGRLDTAEKILGAMAAAWADHRDEMKRLAPPAAIISS